MINKGMSIFQRGLHWVKGRIHFIRDEIKYNNWTDILLLIGGLVLLFVGVVLILAVLAFCVLWPLALAWAVNYLFHTNIPLNFSTWLAIFVIGWALRYLLYGKNIVELKWKQ